MDSDIEYKFCLKKLLHILNISENRLAKGINVDPSLISRWVNGKRPISTKSNYIEDISLYLSKSVNDKFQIRAIEDMCKLHEIETKVDINNIKECIYNLIATSQRRIIASPYSKKYVSSMDEKIDKCYTYQKSNHECVDISELVHGNSLICSSVSPCCIAEKFEIYHGHKNILDKVFDMFKLATCNCPTSKRPIMMTFLSNIDITPEYDDFAEKLINILPKIIANGWRISIVLLLNNNGYRNKKIVQAIKNVLPSESIDAYYIKKYGIINNPTERVIVPGIGAISCFCNVENTKIESAFFFKDEEVINVLEEQFFHLYSQSIPLLDKYSGSSRLAFEQSMHEAEEHYGNHFLYKEGLSFLTIPQNLFEKYVSRCNLPSEIKNKLIKYHKIKLNAFYNQKHKYAFYNICSKKSLEELIKSNTYKSSASYFFYNIKATNQELVEHLENVIHLIENNGTFKIALSTNSNNFKPKATSWILKQSSGVFMDVCDFKNENNRIILSISESTITTAFEDSFMEAWHEIPPVYREDNCVIKWFKEKIKEIKKRELSA